MSENIPETLYTSQPAHHAREEEQNTEDKAANTDYPRTADGSTATAQAIPQENIHSQSVTVSAFVTPGFEERVLGELEELRNRFTHKIAEDRAKNQLIVAVQQSLRERDETARGEAYRSIFKEILVALDRLISQDPSAALTESVREEILDILALRGLERIEAQGLYNPAIHEVAGVVPADETHPAGSIVSEVKEGFMLADRVLRPALVTVARAAQVSNGVQPETTYTEPSENTVEASGTLQPHNPTAVPQAEPNETHLS